MKTVPVLSAALYGIRENLRMFEETAVRIARTAPLTGDLPRDLVDLRLARHGVAANVRVAQTADEMIGSLLDILA